VQPFQSELWPGAVAQQVLAPGTVLGRDAHQAVDGKAASITPPSPARPLPAAGRSAPAVGRPIGWPGRKGLELLFRTGRSALWFARRLEVRSLEEKGRMLSHHILNKCTAGTTQALIDNVKVTRLNR